MADTIKIVIVDTLRTSSLGCIGSSSLFRIDTTKKDVKLEGVPDIEYKHAHVLSHGRIEHGDWFIRMIDQVIIKANVNSDHQAYLCYKIIASTDTTLGLPVISAEGEIMCCKAYNTGNGKENADYLSVNIFNILETK